MTLNQECIEYLDGLCFAPNTAAELQRKALLARLMTKKSRTAKQAVPVLNAIGKPYSPQFDPNYRMKYHPRKYAPSGPMVGEAVTPERWRVMVNEARSAWEKFMQEGV